MNTFYFFLLCLLPALSIAQQRQWQALPDSASGEVIYRWSDTGIAFSEPELRRLAESDPALGIRFPQDRIASNLLGAGISFGMAVIVPIALRPGADKVLTVDQLKTRQNAQLGTAIGFAALGIVFTAMTAHHLQSWRPIASPQGVGIGITLK